MRSAWKVDLVMRKDRRFSHEELARGTEQEILGVVVPTASAEDTIIAKLEWAKEVPASRTGAWARFEGPRSSGGFDASCAGCPPAR
jgi:hypothetical protein